MHAVQYPVHPLCAVCCVCLCVCAGFTVCVCVCVCVRVHPVCAVHLQGLLNSVPVRGHSRQTVSKLWECQQELLRTQHTIET